MLASGGRWWAGAGAYMICMVPMVSMVCVRQARVHLLRLPLSATEAGEASSDGIFDSLDHSLPPSSCFPYFRNIRKNCATLCLGDNAEAVSEAEVQSLLYVACLIIRV